MTPVQQIGSFGVWGAKVRVWAVNGTIYAQYNKGAIGVRDRETKTWPDSKKNRAVAIAWAKEVADHLKVRRAKGSAVSSQTKRLTTRGLKLKWFAAERKRWRPATVRLFEEAWRVWEEFIGPDSIAEDVSALQVGQFRAALERRPSRSGTGWAVRTIQSTIGVIRIAYGWANGMKLIRFNHVRDYRFKVGKDERPRQVPEFTEEETMAIESVTPLHQAETWRVGALVRMADLTGGRENAMLHLDWSDIDLDAGTIFWRREWSKTGEDSVQRLRPGLVAVFQEIRRWTDGKGWVFPKVSSRNAQPTYSAKSAIDGLHRACRRCGVAVVKGRAFHSFRRKVTGDALSASGGDLKAAMAITGHKSTKNFETYLRDRPDDMRNLQDRMDARKTAKRLATITKTRPVGALASTPEALENQGLMTSVVECTAQDLNLEPTDRRSKAAVREASGFSLAKPLAQCGKVAPISQAGPLDPWEKLPTNCQLSPYLAGLVLSAPKAPLELLLAPSPARLPGDAWGCP